MWPVKKQKPWANEDARQLVHDIEQQLEKAARARLTKMTHAMASLEKGWERSLEDDLVYVVETTGARQALRNVRRVPVVAGDTLKFQVSSRVLRESWQYLTSDPSGHERLHLVTGTITADGTRVLSHMEKVGFEEGSKSAGYVAGNAGQTHKRLIELERDGHELLAMWHSHIMKGEASSTPSQVDLDNQARFVSLGWDAIGGIFTLDGYIRLFGTGKAFTVDLYGKGARIVRRSSQETIIKLEV